VTTTHPIHHPPEELLVDYASGSLSHAESLLIETHLGYCAHCRLAAGENDAVGGALLSALEPAQLPPNMLNRTLAAIDAESHNEPNAIAAAPAGEAWRKLPGGYGMRRIESPGSGDARLWLVKAPPGKGLLKHSHVGEEWTVVMQGAFSDSTGAYRKGDFVALGDGFEHQPVAGPGEDCVCLFLIRGQPVFTTMMGKLMAPFIQL
jgi:putative transcriptional regulator